MICLDEYMIDESQGVIYNLNSTPTRENKEGNQDHKLARIYNIP
jgi:hypothetical protein